MDLQSYEISTDKSRLDLDRVVGWLGQSYWASGRSRELIDRSVENSLCFGAYLAGEQVGFCRVVTDFSTFAWLCDVWVDEAHRGRGVSKLLVKAVMATPGVGDLRLVLLGTSDAHGLYRQFGFQDAPTDRFMLNRQDCCDGPV